MNFIFHLYFSIYFFRYFLSYIFLDFEIEKMIIHQNNITLLLTLLHYTKNILKEIENTSFLYILKTLFLSSWIFTYLSLRKNLNTNLSIEVSFVP